MSERVLVTGADGFVGRTVCRRLLSLGYIPRAGLLSPRLEPGFRSRLPEVGEVVILGDLGGQPALAEAVKGVSSIIHLAARVHVTREHASDPLAEFRRVNVGGTVSLARTAAEHGVRRFVLASTAKVNGEWSQKTGFSETDPPAPRDAYAQSKWEAEEALRSIAACCSVEFAIVRPPLVYGPGVRANFLTLMHLVRRGIPLPLPDNHNRRSLVGVENLADFLVRCAVNSEAANQTFMISDGEDISTRELCSRLARMFGRSPRFLGIPESLLRVAAQVAGRPMIAQKLLGSLVVNSGKARQVLGWTPPFSLDDGLRAATRWYMEAQMKSAQERN